MHTSTILLALVGMLAALGMVAMALTTEPGLRQSSSAYKNLAFEDLMDMVDRVDPAETPLYTMARREAELGNTEFAWEVDSWPTPLGAVGPGDGFDVQDAEIRDVTASKRKMGNYGQAFRRAFGAGWIANAVPRLPGQGRGKLLAQGATDAMVLLKQDIECAFGSFDQTAAPDISGATGSVMAGLFKLIDPANKYANATAFTYGKPTDLHTAPATACVTGALANAFNLTSIRNVSRALRDATKRNKEYVLLAGLDLRAQVTSLIDPATTSASGVGMAATQSHIFTQSLSDSALGQSIDVIRTDWGRWAVVPTDFIGTTTLDAGGVAADDTNRAARVFTAMPKYGYLLSREKLFKRWGVGFETIDLPNSGGGQKKAVRCYLTLGVGNPIGFGYYKLT